MLTTKDALDAMRARVGVLLQAILVAANMCVRSLPHTLILMGVPHDADPEVWLTLPIHPDTPMAVAYQIFQCLALGHDLSPTSSTSHARFLLLAAHHLQSPFMWARILPVLSRRNAALLLTDLVSFDPTWATEVCSTIFRLPHVNLDVLVALRREWPVGVFLREIHPQIANLVRFWDSHLPLADVQTTCILCRAPIIRYTPVLGPHAPTTPLFCCQSLVHSACLDVYIRSQAGGSDPKVPCLFCDAPQVETHDWRAQDAWQHDPDVRSYLDTLTPHWLAPDMSADLCWLTQRTNERTGRPLNFGEIRRLGLVPTKLQSSNAPGSPQGPVQALTAITPPPSSDRYAPLATAYSPISPPSPPPPSSPSPSSNRTDSHAQHSSRDTSPSGRSSITSNSRDVQRLLDEIDFRQAPRAALEPNLERWLEDAQ